MKIPFSFKDYDRASYNLAYSIFNKTPLISDIQFRDNEIKYLEDTSEQRVFIEPAGYSQPISQYPLSENTFKIHQKSKDFLGRKAIYERLEKYKNQIRDGLYILPVKLIAEQNPHDDFAVAIVVAYPETTNNELKQYFNYCHIGYIPKQYSQLVRRNINRFYSGQVISIDGDKAPFSCTVVFKIEERKEITIESERFRNLLFNE